MKLIIDDGVNMELSSTRKNDLSHKLHWPAGGSMLQKSRLERRPAKRLLYSLRRKNFVNRILMRYHQCHV
jgi:hypothetical protein